MPSRGGGDSPGTNCPARDEVLRPAAAARSGAAAAAERAAGPRGRVEADARIRPRGFGKTTLLTEWLAAGPSAPAGERGGVAVTRSGRQPSRHLLGVRHRGLADGGIRGRRACAGPAAAAQPPAVEAVLAALLNDLAAIAGDIVLVLDDYHVIDAPEVHDGMATSSTICRRGCIVVIATRADPPLPLARLRARGELAEIRAAELRFTVRGRCVPRRDDGPEADGAGHDLLEARTEGWIAALQLAALSMQGQGRRRASLQVSRAMIDTSSTTWPRRSCSASRTASGPSCCRPASSAGSAARSVMPSPGRAAARRAGGAGPGEPVPGPAG